MLLEEGLDTGPILMQQTLAVGPDKTAVDLFEELAQAGAPLLVETLARLAAGSITPRPQDHAAATLAPILTREDGRMDFAAYTARQLYNRWRGFQPWPGASTALEGKKLIVHHMKPAEKSGPESTAPGSLRIENGRLLVSCAAGSWLELIEVQLEGKKRMAAADFLRGLKLAAETRLG
jgi:methionyl-tRNA formyltransferase